MIRFTFAVLCLFPALDIHAAWVRPAGETYVQLGGSYTSATSVYDPAGGKQAIPRFTEVATNIYGEFGITNRWTIGYVLPVLFSNQAEDVALPQATKSASGLGDSIWSNRYQVYSGVVLISAGLDIGMPTGNRNAPIPLGDGEASVIPKMMLGGGFTLGLPGFYLISAGYNKRTIGFSDEVHGGAMGGLTLGEFTLILSLELRQSLKNGEGGNLNESPLLLNNASFATWSIGTVFKATERLQVLVFYKGGLYVHNILGAPSMSLAVGYRF
jgi:protein XagA